MASLQDAGFVEAAWVEAKAAKAYSALATRYASGFAGVAVGSESSLRSAGPFFFGAQPTCLDVAVWAHLSAARIQAPISGWVAKHAFPALQPFFAAFRAMLAGEGAVGAGGGAALCEPLAVRGPTNMWLAQGTALDKELLQKARAAQASRRVTAAHNAAVAAQGAPVTIDAAAPLSPPAPAAADATPSVESSLASAAKTTAHGRTLTGMDAVSVSRRTGDYLSVARGGRGDDDATPTGAAATATAAPSDAGAAAPAAAASESSTATMPMVAPAQLVAERYHDGFGVDSKLLDSTHAAARTAASASPWRDALVTVGILATAIVIIRAIAGGGGGPVPATSSGKGAR